MDCEKCNELLGDFLDGTLAGNDRSLLGAHLDECLGCACVRDEIRSIVSTAQESREYFVAPPNERALWLRVRNTIEAELNADQKAAAWSAAAAGRENFLSRLMNKRWALSFPQLAAAVVAIVVGVSVVTTVGVQRLGNDVDRPQPGTPTVRNERNLSSGQMIAIQYLMQRVEERKARWNPRMREAFDRNLSVIDATVSDSMRELDESPHDEISEESLNAALRDKMELLREFSEL